MTDVPIWVPLVTGLGGLVVGRFSMSKKERADVDQKNYENSTKVTETHHAAYQAYVDALTAYHKSGDPTFDDFVKLASSGDVYFLQVSRMCETILANKADEGIRDNTWLPKIKRAFDSLLPAHYDSLQAQAKKKAYPYTGKLRRQDHESIFAVAEQFSATAAWQRPYED